MSKTDTPVINAELPIATPDNTPLPGGGRWTWDRDNCCWAEKPAEPDQKINPKKE